MEGKWPLILISIIVSILTIYIVKFLNWVWFHPKKLEIFLRKQGLNGTPYTPFLQDLKDFSRITQQEKTRSIQLSDDVIPHMLPHYHHLSSKYGQNNFTWMGPYARLNISDVELIKEILRQPYVFEKGLPKTFKILTNGLSSLDGEKWAERRKIINPAFHMDKLKNMVGAMNESCGEMVDTWEKIGLSSNEIDVWPFLQDLTGDVISRTAFGSNCEEGRRVFELQREKAELTLQLSKFFFIPGWRYIPSKASLRMIAISREMESILREMIEKRQREGRERDDLLGILLKSNSRLMEEENARGMSIEDVIKECQLFYFAGAETTASLLVWTMILLAIHTEWQARARDEVLGVLGNSDPTYEALSRLKTVTMILQEVLRLYAPIPQTMRKTKETVKLGNMTIPGGVYLGILLAPPAYDPKIWGDNVKEFNPERFADGASKNAHSSFAPFGLGPRICIGMNFAMIEAKMAIAMILRSFSFHLSPSYSHNPFTVFTTTPQNGAPLILHYLHSPSN